MDGKSKNLVFAQSHYAGLNGGLRQTTTGLGLLMEADIGSLTVCMLYCHLADIGL